MFFNCQFIFFVLTFIIYFQTNGIENRAGISDQVARELLEEARKSLNTVQADLQPHLNNSADTVNQIQRMNEVSDAQTTAINM